MLPSLLLPWCLLAQEPGPIKTPDLDLRTSLGQNTMALICLAPRGCWNGLVLGADPNLPRPESTRRKRPGEATVEVWDLLPPSRPRAEAFTLYLESLRERMSKAWLAPPPKHQSIELGEFMQSDPSNPQHLDLTRVKSLQERFNQLPPNGSPVRQN
jgi:hypothetical protein